TEHLEHAHRRAESDTKPDQHAQRCGGRNGSRCDANYDQLPVHGTKEADVQFPLKTSRSENDANRESLSDSCRSRRLLYASDESSLECITSSLARALAAFRGATNLAPNVCRRRSLSDPRRRGQRRGNRITRACARRTRL